MKRGFLRRRRRPAKTELRKGRIVGGGDEFGYLVRVATSRPCLVCEGRAEHAHHLYPRSRGGDDVAANLVGLCSECHRRVHDHDRLTRQVLYDRLPAESVAYCESKEPYWLERIYG